MAMRAAPSNEWQAWWHVGIAHRKEMKSYLNEKPAMLATWKLKTDVADDEMRSDGHS